MELINFTDLPKRNKAYAGANGNKISVIYQDEQYMLKFPSHARLNKDMSYSNSCFSEYLGCKIYESLGISVQKVLLGTYNSNGRERIVVACKDFTEPGIILQDFASLKNQMIDSERSGYGTELSDILYTFEEQSAFDPVLLERRFWDMFIVDTFIGNWDRHNGNWGFLYDTRTDHVELAPVYDCGSSLYPQADDNIMKSVLSDPSELQYRIYEVPTSAIQHRGKRIKYYDFISSFEYPACNEALKRIVPQIDLDVIHEIINDIPLASDLQRDFYKAMLSERKALILDRSLKLLEEKEPFDYTEWRREHPEDDDVRSLSRKAMEYSKTLD